MNVLERARIQRSEPAESTVDNLTTAKHESQNLELAVTSNEAIRIPTEIEQRSSKNSTDNIEPKFDVLPRR